MTHSFPTRRSSDLAPRSIQRPQPRRVGRGNVYGEIAREAGHRPRALGIIGDSVVRVLVCADVDADDAGPAMPPREPLRRRCLAAVVEAHSVDDGRSEEHTSELQSLIRISYAVFCVQKKIQT